MKLSITEEKLDLLELQNGTDETDENDTTMDVFCIIDRSGSMSSDNKLGQVKQSLNYLLDVLKPEDRISLVIFDDHAQQILPLKFVGDSRATIETTIAGIQTAGCTNIQGGLEEAFKGILNRKTKNQVTGILLLTDGMDNTHFHSEIANVDRFFNQWEDKLKNENLTIHTFGYGDNHNADMLDHIAKKKKGNFYYVKDLELVSDSFVDCLGALSSVIAKDVEITVKLDKNSKLFPEIHFKRTFGSLWKGESETERQITIGNIIKGYKKDFIFEITLNGVKEPNMDLDQDGFKICKLIEATLSMKNLSEKNHQVTSELFVETLRKDLDSEIAVTENEEVKKN